jgi:hypothetical protein
MKGSTAGGEKREKDRGDDVGVLIYIDGKILLVLLC